VAATANKFRQLEIAEAAIVLFGLDESAVVIEDGCEQL
jgi:hypothetical protein